MTIRLICWSVNHLERFEKEKILVPPEASSNQGNCVCEASSLMLENKVSGDRACWVSTGQVDVLAPLSFPLPVYTACPFLSCLLYLLSPGWPPVVTLVRLYYVRPVLKHIPQSSLSAPQESTPKPLCNMFSEERVPLEGRLVLEVIHGSFKSGQFQR